MKDYINKFFNKELSMTELETCIVVGLKHFGISQEKARQIMAFLWDDVEAQKYFFNVLVNADEDLTEQQILMTLMKIKQYTDDSKSTNNAQGGYNG